jgi:hypothetical protein
VTDEKKNVLISIPEAWFASFVRWLGKVPISSVDRLHVINVHRVHCCFAESYEEYYGEQLDFFKEN